MLKTISKTDDVARHLGKTLKIMACHEMEAAHCIGWLNHQLGLGNNIRCASDSWRLRERARDPAARPPA